MGGELPPLSDAARELLAEERVRGPEDAALKQRVVERAREALLQDRPSGVALRQVGTSAFPAARRAAPRTVLLIAAALGVAGLAAAGAGAYRWSITRELVQPIERQVAPAPLPPEPIRPPLVAPPSVAAQAPVHAPPERVRPASPAESAHAMSVQTYAIEAGLLEPARSGIGSGNYAGALAAIARHQREYPRGQLAEEREALRVRALWGMGQKAAAESAAASFRKRYPRSVLLSWMKEPAKQER